jgi:hypothetical protein
MTWDEFWVHEFGNVPTATDFAGRRVNRKKIKKIALFCLTFFKGYAIFNICIEIQVPNEPLFLLHSVIYCVVRSPSLLQVSYLKVIFRSKVYEYLY